MGKYMRKCKGIGGVAVMEVSPVGVGVRTRARTLALATAAKRKKSVSGELRARRGPENSNTARKSENSSPVGEDRCSSPEQIAVSHCSSNGSSERVIERLISADHEGFGTATDFDSRDRRETTPSSQLRSESDDLESTARLFETNSCRRSTAEKMASEEEIEAFFSTFEKDKQRQFAERYNYDVVKDVPLEGRYEWVRLK